VGEGVEALEVRRKRLMHRSRYRGVKEGDLLFGQFAANWLRLLNDAQLDRYEALLEAPDQDVLAWVYGRAPVPERFDHDVFRMLKNFEPGA
jgi:succinate dehydrogenase flavin-adding protein (antitoxin of CptAB toxin-antitoxin module)